MKNANIVHKNQLIDTHFDDLLRVACNIYKPDILKIVKKKLSKHRQSHQFQLNITFFQ